jgi:NADPH-dependent 2,4-dienoyl-CoA reductase/sulfur reductase-like enzyme
VATAENVHTRYWKLAAVYIARHEAPRLCTVMSTPLSSQAPKVLVCGGGPAGLVAALSLCKNGIPVRIIDKSPEYQAGTRGPSLAVGLACLIQSY